MGKSEYGSCSGGVVVGTVINEIGAGVGGVRLPHAEVVEVRGEEDGFAVGCGAGEDGDGVPGFRPRGIGEPGQALLDARRER